MQMQRAAIHVMYVEALRLKRGLIVSTCGGVNIMTVGTYIVACIGVSVSMVFSGESARCQIPLPEQCRLVKVVHQCGINVYKEVFFEALD